MSNELRAIRIAFAHCSSLTAREWAVRIQLQLE